MSPTINPYRRAPRLSVKDPEWRLDDIVKVGPLIRHAHLAENKDRAPLGVNGENLRPYLRALRRTDA